MNSCLYECTVFHRRFSPKRHEFLYRVFYFCLDLEEIENPSGVGLPGWPWLGLERSAVFSFRPGDHLGKKSSAPLRSRVEAFLADNGLPTPARIRFLTNLRIFGYVFNPIAIYFCEKADGSPLAAVAQVGNTFGEQKLFLVKGRTPASAEPLTADSTRAMDYTARLPKEFYVSPFSDLDLDFDFRFAAPDENLRVLIDEYRGEEKILISSLTGKRRPLTCGRLLWFLCKYPLLTLKVIFLIHWQALRLWAKGLPFRRKEQDPEKQTNVLNPRDSHFF